MIASIVSALRAPIPRHFEVTGPHVNPFSAGGVLVGDVIYRISSVCDGPAVCHHPAIEVLGTFEADRNDATIAIDIALLAADSCPSNSIRQRKARLLPAAPAFAICAHAELAAFWGVDTKQTNALAADFDSVTV